MHYMDKFAVCGTSRHLPIPFTRACEKEHAKGFAEYSRIGIILDCTELFIEWLSAMLAQSETWSEYKHHNTWKVFVGVAPNGQVSYLSELWGGSQGKVVSLIC